MENSTMDPDTLVHQINNDMAELLLPATIYICVLMITGLIGNLMVCFYYGFRTKKAPTTIFIVTLAAYDLTVCAICMPTELADIYKFYTFENGPACKILRFINYFAAIASIFTLIIIAVDRYKHIRRATDVQMSITAAKKYCVIIAVVALLLSWPSLLIYNSVNVPIPNNYGLELTGADCTSTKSQSYKPYVWTFNVVHFVAFLICSAVLIVLYGIIGRTIYKHRKRLSRYRITTITTASDTQSSSVNQSDDDKQPEETDKHVTKDNRDQSSDIHTESGQPTNSETGQPENCIELENKVVESKKDKKSTAPSPRQWLNAKLCLTPSGVQQSFAPSHQRRSTEGTIDKETIRMTLLMISVTAVFIISFLPYLSLTVWRIYKGQHEAEFLSRAGLVAFKIGSRSFLLNSSLNPWIYGVFNSRFRQYYYHLLCCKSAS